MQNFFPIIQSIHILGLTVLVGTIAIVDMRLLDAGCGHGRNLHYFLRRGFDVAAVDESELAIAHVRQQAGDIARRLP